MKNLTISPVAPQYEHAHSAHFTELTVMIIYAYHIQDKVYTPYSFNLQQQNASQTWSNFLTDLELEASDNLEYLTWYGLVKVASAWHAHMAL